MGKIIKVNPFLYAVYLLMIIYTFCILMMYDSLSLRFHASIALFAVLSYLVSYKISNKKVITPLTLIIISFCLFQSGQTLLFALGYEDIFLLKWALLEEIIIAQIFFNYSLILLLIGTTFKTAYNINTVEKQDIHLNRQISYLKKIGIISLIITLFPKLLIDIYLARFSLSGGYSEIRNYTTFVMSTNGFLYIAYWIAGFFNFALYVCLVAFYKDKRTRNRLLILMLIISVLELISGARYEAVTRLSVYLFLILDFQQSKKSSIKSAVVVGLGGILILILNIVKVFRQLDEKNITQFISMISQRSGFIDGIVELIIEMGGSMYPFILINRFVPSTRFFGGGTSYLFSIFSVIPQKLLLGFDYSKYTNLQEWLTFEVLNQNSGVGFSMCAEAYYNFGWLGLPLFFFLGLLITNVFDSNKLKNKSLSFKLFSVFLFDALLFYPRGQIVTFMRPIILMIGVIILINRGNIKYIKNR
ncbi:O-antigen polysaccharide polymerase Wzy [Geosporobacter ferrireducens]|uniref:O-antigen polysaccharide polymerase Wzy n=1 Tax=Geosporobacter ferrireducens TaxID=1424294 RepID=A0A1D8GGV4_9FIRM|nr:O-antigen polysaccharide polymerase Wzy [Geosporobacter ferrireducens]AOT70127.1 hypothetical protein Gferi_11315 [Geosporobacter ferrireducens]